jgi:hypothetical protein
MRRRDKLIESREDLDRVVAAAKYVAVAMCDEGHPYLVALSHGYDAQSSCLYFHCAPKGRKIDVLERDAEVYGQAMVDLGYQQGSCDHLFETVQFEGTVVTIGRIDIRSLTGKRSAKVIVQL